MTNNVSNLFTISDRLQIQSLEQRLKKHQVIAGNIVNSETPGYRALGYDFEKQLQDLANLSEGIQLKTSHPTHLKSALVTAEGNITPDVYIQPTESVGEDGNTVDVDKEMASLAENQILYRSAVEIINRKMGLIKYAINGGR
ncbi:MAG: flagellar basal body rod protein FlgB [Oligoflexales bacterium]|nr:flagellar basal body rod protein FlgB [Oligoflexales bacterium]